MKDNTVQCPFCNVSHVVKNSDEVPKNYGMISVLSSLQNSMVLQVSDNPYEAQYLQIQN